MRKRWRTPPRRFTGTFSTLTDQELLRQYREFVPTCIPTGGNYSGGKQDALLLREMEQEMARRGLMQGVKP